MPVRATSPGRMRGIPSPLGGPVTLGRLRAVRRRRLARISLREIGVPDYVVGAVVFLAATSESRRVTIWGA